MPALNFRKPTGAILIINRKFNPGFIEKNCMKARLQMFLIMATFIFASCGEDRSGENQKSFNKDSADTATMNLSDSGIPAVGADTVGNSTTEEILNDIRAEFRRINALPLDAQKHNFHCDTDGTITYYEYNNKVVKVMIDWGFLGDGSTKSEYYYRDGKLIFEFEIFINQPPGLPDTRMEQRIYVDGDKTIRFMRDQEVIACRKCEFTGSSREYRVLQAYKSGDINSALCN